MNNKIRAFNLFKNIKLPSGYKKKLNEALFLLILAFSILLFISLISYSYSDAIWSQSRQEDMILNYGGYFGALMADILFSIIGLSAYLIPIALGLFGWGIHLIATGRQKFNGLVFLLRFISFLILLISCSGFLSQNLYIDSGGWIGQDIHLIFKGWFGSLVIIIYLSLIMVSSTLSSGVSWLKVFDMTGSLFFKALVLMKDNIVLYKQHKLEKKQAIQAKKDRHQLLSANMVVDKAKPKIIAQNEKIKVSENKEIIKQANLFKSNADFSLPNLSLLSQTANENVGYSNETLEAISRQVELKLKDFGFDVSVATVTPGPVVTQFEVSLAPGVKANQIVNLSKDLARALLVENVRIQDVIVGKEVIGLEIPNAEREIIDLRELLSSAEFKDSKSFLTIAIGKDINGHPIIIDLAKMPHLLVAGATGMGKSVGLNAMILSILYKSTPDDVRMIMIDPKVVELSIYADTPHLLTPVVTDMHEAANCLRWCVNEMERRYTLLAKFSVRNISSFNKKISTAKKKNNPLRDPFFNKDSNIEGNNKEAPELQTMPLIVVIIDEYADMLGALSQEDRSKAKKVEALIIRLAQKARAAGIHLIIATQRPSVDVITGLIKSNIPSRIAFKVSSKIDSRTILDQGGAEQLLGMGDMLYLTPGMRKLQRVHGAFVKDKEVEDVISYLKEKNEKVSYIDGIKNPALEESFDSDSNSTASTNDLDPLYDEVLKVVTETRRASISSIQRRFRIGYNRAARIIEDMEKEGVVTPMSSSGQREVIAPPPIKD